MKNFKKEENECFIKDECSMFLDGCKMQDIFKRIFSQSLSFFFLALSIINRVVRCLIRRHVMQQQKEDLMREITEDDINEVGLSIELCL